MVHQDNPHNPQNKKQMHPEDRKNLVIFFFVCIGIIVLYNQFFLKPQQEKWQEQAKQVAEKQAETAAMSPQELKATHDATRDLTVNEALADAKRISIKSDTITGSISLKGGRLDDLFLNKYHDTVEDDNNIVLLTPSRTAHPQYADFGWLAGEGQAIATPTQTTIWALAKDNVIDADGNVTFTPQNPVKLVWNNHAGLIFTRTISVDDKYVFKIHDNVTNNSGETVTLYPFASISRVGLPKNFRPSPIVHEGPIAYLDGELYEPNYKDLDKGEDKLSLNAKTGWMGITEKYWFTAILPQQDENARYKIDTSLLGEKSRYHVDYTGGGVQVAAGQSVSHDVHFFAGPKVMRMLESYSDKLNIKHLDLAVDFGIFYFMTRPFFSIVTWIGHTTGSFAIAILVFTVMLRLAVFPLANKSFRSFARMRKITPQMVELREKHGTDRTKLQQEIFALYQKEKVNPMAGCLPILIQIPIFFSLYKVLYMSIEMRHAPFWGWISDMSVMDPTNAFTLFGLVPWDVPTFLHIGAWPLIMGFTLLMQQRLNPPAQDPVQQKMMMFMPVFITYILAKFPAGLVIYWSWTNTLSMVQQMILMKKEGVEIHLFKRSKAEQKLEELVEKGPTGVNPAVEMIEEDIEDFIDGDFEHEGSDDGAAATDEKPKKKGKTTAKNPAAKKKSTGKKTTVKKKAGIKKPNAKNSLKGK